MHSVAVCDELRCFHVTPTGSSHSQSKLHLTKVIVVRLKLEITHAMSDHTLRACACVCVADNDEIISMLSLLFPSIFFTLSAWPSLPPSCHTPVPFILPCFCFRALISCPASSSLFCSAKREGGNKKKRKCVSVCAFEMTREGDRRFLGCEYYLWFVTLL